MLTDADILAQVFAAFRAEQAEHRQAAADLLLDLERTPDHPQQRMLIDQLFREAHSLKGGARAAGLLAIEQVAHRIEDIFAAARQGTLTLTPHVCDPVYAALDLIGVLMQTATPGDAGDLNTHEALLQDLAAIVATQTAPPETAPALETPTPSAVEAPTPKAEVIANTAAPAPTNSTHPSSDERTVRLSTSVLDQLMNEAGELMSSTLRTRQLAREVSELGALPERWRRTWRRINPTISRMRSSSPTLNPVVHHLQDRHGLPENLPLNDTGDHVQRQLIEALEQAHDLISELSAGLNRLSRQANEDHTRLAAVSDRLQLQVRRTRMLPLAGEIGPLRLQLREMARSAAKAVDLQIDDGDAEADRQVLEQLREICTHLLRNAVDHGLEAPEQREAVGKSPVGVIRISAEVIGDRLSLTVADDGRGLDIAAIRRRASEAGLISVADLDRVDEHELTDLIFLAGFSTRSSVSTLSGRGVGLDVVRTKVERMGGHVSVSSTAGQGTSFRLSVPLSLASSHGLLLRAGSALYVLPLDTIQRIVPVQAGHTHLLEGRPVLQLNGRALPLVLLSELLGDSSAVRTSNGSSHFGLILGVGERQIACLVDSVVEELELVVHRLPAPLQRVRFVAGATILADGRVVPILDAVDIVRAASGANRAPTLINAPSAPKRTPTVLVADDSITTRTLEKNILEAAGYHVVLATDGQEAIERLRSMGDNGGCDLLLSDIDMPRLNGFDLTSQIRSDPQFRHLPIVLVTSLDSQADRERGVAAGADAYIVKRSFDQQNLLETITRLL
jgi:two-component system chemotaxis sensor kinase CheA